MKVRNDSKLLIQLRNLNEFSLLLGAGVCHFLAEVDGRNIEGIVKETEKATIDYEQAIQSGHSAFLVEEKLPDVFKVTNDHPPIKTFYSRAN